jgi:hypothetical protein
VTARGVALVAVCLLAAGCGARLYSNADAARAAQAPRHELRQSVQPFATWLAVTELQIDFTLPTGVWGNGRLAVERFPTPEAAQALAGTFPRALLAAEGLTFAVRRNVLITGGRAAVAAALARLR